MVLTETKSDSYEFMVESPPTSADHLDLQQRPRFGRLGRLGHNLVSSVSGRNRSRSPSPMVAVPPQNDSPPAYDDLAPKRPVRASTQEKLADILRNYDTVIIVDDSGSMTEPAAPELGAYPTRWEEARDAIAGIAEKAALYDADGLDIHFLNHANKSGYNLKKPASVMQLFSEITPHGKTPIGRSLQQLVCGYLDRLQASRIRTKPVNFIVITDGRPTDNPLTVLEIVNAAMRLDYLKCHATQLGIQFVQIGQDPKASAFLDELDNELSTKYKVRDIVDTQKYLGELTDSTLAKILVGAIHRRTDNNEPGVSLTF